MQLYKQAVFKPHSMTTYPVPQAAQLALAMFLDTLISCRQVCEPGFQNEVKPAFSSMAMS